MPPIHLQQPLKDVFWISDNITCPLGFDSEECFSNIKQKKSSVKLHPSLSLPGKQFFASLFDENQLNQLNNISGNSLFERIAIKSISKTLEHYPSIDFNDTILILPTTKGNITSIENGNYTPLSKSAEEINRFFKLKHRPIVLSNACISGVAALITAKRLLAQGVYSNAIVCGADIITSFVAKGFQSLHATANEHCKPYDKDRTGINLGEAAASVLLSSSINSKIKVLDGALTNDANHISGPSKTGEELAHAITQTMSSSSLSIEDIAFIAAHGTATMYNDEMESKAFEKAGFSATEVYSLKPHFGHSLGAAGVIETIVAVKSIEEGVILPNLNFENSGVSGNIKVATSLASTTKKAFLKTASGFGGCNASLAICKV
jgi:3-oxoacyl-[acyl-carrier-protein] synthase-1